MKSSVLVACLLATSVSRAESSEVTQAKKEALQKELDDLKARKERLEKLRTELEGFRDANGIINDAIEVLLNTPINSFLEKDFRGKSVYELFRNYLSSVGQPDFLKVESAQSLVPNVPQTTDKFSIYRNVEQSQDICEIEISENRTTARISCPESGVYLNIYEYRGNIARRLHSSNWYFYVDADFWSRY